GFARAGYAVVNISYRLAPSHPFPAALEDTCAAYLWLAQHGPRHGMDLSRVVVAGESAGGNLVTALALAHSMRRAEPVGRAGCDAGVVPRAGLPAYAMLPVSESERFGRVFPRL